MKNLVVFYSMQGNTEFVANTIAKETNSDMLKLKPKKELRKFGFLKYFIGGMQSLFKIKPKLVKFDKDPQDYDTLFIGSPVWASTYSSPFNTFFNQVDLKDKKIALFCSCQGDKGKTFKNMKEKLKDNEIVGEMDFFEPLHKDREMNTKKAADWARNIVFK